MKYGYIFNDWSLFDIIEIIDVQELDKDYIRVDKFGSHVFSKNDYVLVTFKNSKDNMYGNGNVGPFYKKQIFDTYNEAYKYGIEHSKGAIIYE